MQSSFVVGVPRNQQRELCLDVMELEWEHCERSMKISNCFFFSADDLFGIHHGHRIARNVIEN